MVDRARARNVDPVGAQRASIIIMILASKEKIAFFFFSSFFIKCAGKPGALKNRQETARVRGFASSCVRALFRRGFSPLAGPGHPLANWQSASESKLQTQLAATGRLVEQCPKEQRVVGVFLFFIFIFYYYFLDHRHESRDPLWEGCRSKGKRPGRIQLIVNAAEDDDVVAGWQQLGDVTMQEARTAERERLTAVFFVVFDVLLFFCCCCCLLFIFFNSPTNQAGCWTSQGLRRDDKGDGVQSIALMQRSMAMAISLPVSLLLARPRSRGVLGLGDTTGMRGPDDDDGGSSRSGGHLSSKQE